MTVNQVVQIIKNGGVGVLPTDTLYGLVGSALSKKAVERIYELRRRNHQKPMIILIGSFQYLKLFGISFAGRPDNRRRMLKKIWPGPVSVILSLPRRQSILRKFRYLHRDTKTLAFRLPKKPALIQFLKKTGPLAAPSANLEGRPPARTASQAKKCFGDQVDFYLNGGRLAGLPSTLIQILR